MPILTSNSGFHDAGQRRLADNVNLAICVTGVAAILLSPQLRLGESLFCLGLLEQATIFRGAINRGFLSHGQLCMADLAFVVLPVYRAVFIAINRPRLSNSLVSGIYKKDKQPDVVLSKLIIGGMVLLIVMLANLMLVPFDLWVWAENGINARLNKPIALALVQVCGVALLPPEIAFWIRTRAELGSVSQH